MPEERVASRFFALDIKLKALWQLCDFAAIGPVARELLSLGSLSESALSQANAMLGISSFFGGERGAAHDSLVQAEIYAGQIRNDFERLDALRTIALCRFIAGDQRKAEETANEALTLGLRHSCYWPTFTLLLLLVESHYLRGKLERARFYLAEAGYLFTAGLLLPAKDQALYYWFAAKLLDREDSGRQLAVARRLLEAERARLARPELVANFLSIRSFGKMFEELCGAGGGAGGTPAGAAPRTEAQTGVEAS